MKKTCKEVQVVSPDWYKATAEDKKRYQNMGYHSGGSADREIELQVSRSP